MDKNSMTTPTHPSDTANNQPSFSSIIKNLKRNDNMIFYTDTVKGKQTLRDDLWAVSSEELDGLVEAVRTLAMECIANVEDHTYTEDDALVATDNIRKEFVRLLKGSKL